MTEHELSSANTSRMTVERTICYGVGAMSYVPHFSAYGVYVAPGYRVTTKEFLEATGATTYKEFLWKRPDEFSSKGLPDGWGQLHGQG